jgi:hypothetical protein
MHRSFDKEYLVSEEEGNIWKVLAIGIENMREVFSTQDLGKIHGEIL